MQIFCFSHPEPQRTRARIWPVFLPFKGCPGKCIYCAQQVQSGIEPVSLETHFHRLEKELSAATEHGVKPLEMAFFGGTFTLLPRPWQRRFLELADLYRRTGLVTRIRCSTRPDAVSRESLLFCRQLGMDLVELGIQSFSDTVLEKSGRGYTTTQSLAACSLVKDSGLALGIQLLPGLPGHDFAGFMSDIDMTCSVSPETVRIYPCLVLKDTPLAELWRRGEFRPWSLESTISALGLALPRLWARDIQIIRMGLAPEQSLEEALLDGPWHPCLGFRVRSRFLKTYLHYRLSQLPSPSVRLKVPCRYLPEVFGYRGENRRLLMEHGLDPAAVTPWNRDSFMLY